MMCDTPVFRLESEFDAFLFAPVGEDGNGLTLSVLSALVRLDVDPWDEAAKLARMPGKKAIERLGALIATLPDGVLVGPAPGAIAVRLVGLLPRQVSRSVPGRPSISALVMSKSRVVAICAIILVCAVIAQWLVVQFEAPTIGTRAPASSTASP